MLKYYPNLDGFGSLEIIFFLYQNPREILPLKEFLQYIASFRIKIPDKNNFGLCLFLKREPEALYQS